VRRDARALITAFEAEMARRLPRAGFTVEPIDESGHRSEADGQEFFVVYADGKAVAVAALRPLEEGVGEIKRMYVVPEARGQGYARRLLTHLEKAAVERGWHTLRLDTSYALSEACRLYVSAGYRQIPPYNDNPFASLWFEKTL